VVTLSIVSLGCARNEVDSEELAAQFATAGFDLIDQPDQAEVVVVNTCGFIEAAKAESIDEILSAAGQRPDGSKPVVIAAGCLADRYGDQLASSLPEADAVIGFDGYPDIAATVRQVLAGVHPPARPPVDRRRQLPLFPVVRPGPAPVLPAWIPSQRHRLTGGPMAPLKIASGCDRTCAFCAIPVFRGAFRSRPAADIVAEATWLATQGVKEVFLVSENTTSYGKDLSRGTLEALLSDLATVDGIERIRLSYLQPAELRQPLIDAIATTPKVAGYFDLPFQHASAPVLKRMRRYGDAQSFLDLLGRIRLAIPDAGIRTNVIVGFPGETQDDVDILVQFLGEAGLDAVGVFPYSDEEGTRAAALDGHLDEEEMRARARDVSEFADTVTAMRAHDRLGDEVSVLIESSDHLVSAGRAGQQGPEDGMTYVRGESLPADRLQPGEIVTGKVVDSHGVDWYIDL